MLTETTPLISNFKTVKPRVKRWEKHAGRFLKQFQGIKTFSTIYMVLLINLIIFISVLLIWKIKNKDFIPSYFSPLTPWDLQLGSVFLCISYALQNFLYVRMCLALACSWFIAYSLSQDKIVIDLFCYNCIMVLLNVKHAINLLYERRYVDFTKEHQQVYDSVFKDFMTHTEYEKMSKIALLRSEKTDIVLRNRGDELTSLILIVSGKVKVCNSKNKIINQYGENEFLDAPEWIHSNLKPDHNTRYKISFVTSNKITYIKWSREQLRYLLENNESIRIGLRAVLGLQTARLWTRNIE